jgi:hypothetical protein
MLNQKITDIKFKYIFCSLGSNALCKTSCIRAEECIINTRLVSTSFKIAVRTVFETRPVKYCKKTHGYFGYYFIVVTSVIMVVMVNMVNIATLVIIVIIEVL